MAEATKDLTVGGYGGMPYGNNFGPFVLKGRFDSVANTIATTDTVQVIKIPAHTLVDDVWFRTIASDAAAMTISIGDNTASGKWFTSIGVSTKDQYYRTLAASQLHKFYSSDDTIDVHVSKVAPDTLILDIFAVCYDCNDYDS